MNPLTRIFAFPHSYEVKALESYSLAHPLEKLHHFPAELEEGDRTGVYLRVVPKSGAPWIGFLHRRDTEISGLWLVAEQWVESQSQPF